MSGVVATVNNYVKGSMARLSVDPDNPFKLLDTVTDPTVVQFKISNPVGVETIYTYNQDPELKRSATGVYYVDYVLDVSGEWTYRFEGSGNFIAVAEGMVFVEPSSF